MERVFWCFWLGSRVGIAKTESSGLQMCGPSLEAGITFMCRLVGTAPEQTNSTRGRSRVQLPS